MSNCRTMFKNHITAGSCRTQLDPCMDIAHTKAFVRLKAILPQTSLALSKVEWHSLYLPQRTVAKKASSGVLSQRFKTTLPSGKVVEKPHPIAFASKCTLALKKGINLPSRIAALKFALDSSQTSFGLPCGMRRMPSN